MRRSRKSGGGRESLDERAIGKGLVEEAVRIVKGDREHTWDELEHRSRENQPAPSEIDELEPVTRL
jgi:hypothetical protein